MNPKALIPLVVGLAIAGFAAKMGFDNLKTGKAEPIKMVSLWQVKQDVPRGAPVVEENLTQLNFPAEFAPQQAIAKKEDILGRVPHTGVPAGVPVLDNMLLPKGKMPGINVPDGFRAVAVKINESSGVDSHLEPGVFVDVIGLFTVRTGKRNAVIAKTVVEKVEVAAVGQRIAPTNPNATAGDDKGRPAKPARAVTLLVRPEHVPQLHLAEQRGKIKLSMRGLGGAAFVDGEDTNTITEDEMLGIEEEQEGEKTDKLAGFFQSLFGGQEEEPQDIVEAPQEPEPVVAQKPEMVWTMTIYNGDLATRVGWTANKPFEPITLGTTGGGNIFEQEDGFEPTGNGRNKKQRRNGSEAEQVGDPNEPAEKVSKPQELFG